MVRSMPAVLTAVAIAALAGGCSSTQQSNSMAVTPAGKQATTANASTEKASKKAIASAPATKPTGQSTQKIVKVAPAKTVNGKAASQSNAKVAAAPVAKATTTAARTPGLVLGLGAGDSLGRAVYVNDVILAAKAAKRQTEFAEVQPKNDGN